MDPFVRRLVERLFDDTQPLSRNRHFHTFETPEGKKALRISKRLKALQKEIAEVRAEGGSSHVTTTRDDSGEVRVEVRLDRLRSSHVTLLDEGEYELLRRLIDAHSLSPLGEDKGEGSARSTTARR